MDYIFTQRELKWLDDLMPDAAKKEKEDSRKLKDEDADKEEEEKEVGLHTEETRIFAFHLKRKNGDMVA